MSIKIDEIENLQLDTKDHGIMILPYNYESDNNHKYNSTSISFYKFAKDKIDIKYFSEPKLLVEQRSGDWFAPILLISSIDVFQSPELVAVICGVVANYVTDFFKGKDKKDIRIKIIYKETETSKFTSIYYEGDLDGLSELETTINKIIHEGSPDE